jgi:hypothetical protein
MSEFNFEIIKHIGVIGEGTKGWKKEVNIVKWNNRNPKMDIRDWDQNNVKMGRGVTLNKEEVSELKNLLNDIDLDDLEI